MSTRACLRNAKPSLSKKYRFFCETYITLGFFGENSAQYSGFCLSPLRALENNALYHNQNISRLLIMKRNMMPRLGSIQNHNLARLPSLQLLADFRIAQAQRMSSWRANRIQSQPRGLSVYIIWKNNLMSIKPSLSLM